MYGRKIKQQVTRIVELSAITTNSKKMPISLEGHRGDLGRDIYNYKLSRRENMKIAQDSGSPASDFYSLG